MNEHNYVIKMIIAWLNEVFIYMYIYIFILDSIRTNGKLGEHCELTTLTISVLFPQSASFGSHP